MNFSGVDQRCCISAQILYFIGFRYGYWSRRRNEMNVDVRVPFRKSEMGDTGTEAVRAKRADT